MNYYNEYDPKAAAWLRELIASTLIPLVNNTSYPAERGKSGKAPKLCRAKRNLTGYAIAHSFHDPACAPCLKLDARRKIHNSSARWDYTVEIGLSWNQEAVSLLCAGGKLNLFQGFACAIHAQFERRGISGTHLSMSIFGFGLDGSETIFRKTYKYGSLLGLAGFSTDMRHRIFYCKIFRLLAMGEFFRTVNIGLFSLSR